MATPEDESIKIELKNGSFWNVILPSALRVIAEAFPSSFQFRIV